MVDGTSLVCGREMTRRVEAALAFSDPSGGVASQRMILEASRASSALMQWGRAGLKCFGELPFDVVRSRMWETS